MIQLITPEFRGSFRDGLAEMHRLRCRVFKDRLGWAVEIAGDQEIDRFDALNPAYLLQYWNGRLCGSVRFLPTTGPYMLRDAFPSLLTGQSPPASATIWESSRFAIDPERADAVRVDGLSRSTYALFAAMIEFALAQRATHIVTVTDARVERILRRAGWLLERISEPQALGATRAVAGYLPTSSETLDVIRARGGIGRPVLWRPALEIAAS